MAESRPITGEDQARPTGGGDDAERSARPPHEEEENDAEFDAWLASLEEDRREDAFALLDRLGEGWR